MSVSARVEFDSAALVAGIRGNVARAQKALDAQVMNDCNFFCPQKTGTLQKSAIIKTTTGSGRVIWETPYAVRQYYEDLDHSRGRNPNATMKWCETAKARYSGNWKALAEEMILK